MENTGRRRVRETEVSEGVVVSLEWCLFVGKRGERDKGRKKKSVVAFDFGLKYYEKHTSTYQRETIIRAYNGMSQYGPGRHSQTRQKEERNGNSGRKGRAKKKKMNVAFVSEYI